LENVTFKDKEKKALVYAVSEIKSADIEQELKEIARVLAGKASGVIINQTSGISGSGTNYQHSWFKLYLR
jgi:ubiquinone/menaquinone biosynthesis C-methylase UbiE